MNSYSSEHHSQGERNHLHDQKSEFPEFQVWLETQISLLNDQIATLTEKWNALYKVVENLKLHQAAGQLKTHEVDQVRDQEREYWQIGKQIDELKTQLTEFEDEWLQFTEDGSVNPKYQAQYETEKEAAQPRLSKQKAAIQREIARTGEDPRNAFDPLIPVGNGYSHLTTGRNAKDLNAGRGVSPEQAGSEFVYRTADTHGGKIRKHKQK